MTDLELIYMLTFLLAVVTLIPLVVGVFIWAHKRSVDLFEPIYGTTVYFIFLFVVRSFYALRSGTLFLGEPPFDPATRRAWILALLYLIIAFGSFFMAYYSRLGVALARLMPTLREEWAPVRLPMILLALTIIGLVAFATLVEYFGGFEGYLTQKQLTLTAGGTTYLYSLLQCLWLGTVVAYIGCLRYGWPSAFTWPLLVLTLVINTSTGSKGLVFFPILSLIIVHHYIKKPIRLGILLVVSGVGLLFTPLFNIYRHAASIDEIFSRWLDLLVDPEVFFIHVASRFHGMDALITAIRDTGGVMDFQLGATWLPLVTAWIPRVLWPDKPIVSFGKIFGETYWAQFFSGTGSAPSVTVLGEGYINLHLAGLVWVAILSGITLRAVYRYLIKDNRGSSAVLVYSLLYGPYLVMFWESDIVGLLTRVSVLCILAILTARLLSRRRSGQVETADESARPATRLHQLGVIDSSDGIR